jgi:dephospho-CoA kinase
MKVGVTGGIGSGKTTVCKVFGVLGIPVFDADLEAREIIEGDQRVRTQLSEIAGDDLFSTGVLDRKHLAKLIFNDSSMLKKVNNLVHPLVFKRFNDWSSLQSAPYVILDAAILFESGAGQLVDKTISVITPLEERIKRVSERSNLSPIDINDRIKNQMNDSDRTILSDYIIYNGENDMIIPAVLHLHEVITNLKDTNIKRSNE